MSHFDCVSGTLTSRSPSIKALVCMVTLNQVFHGRYPNLSNIYANQNGMTPKYTNTTCLKLRVVASIVKKIGAIQSQFFQEVKNLCQLCMIQNPFLLFWFWLEIESFFTDIIIFFLLNIQNLQQAYLIFHFKCFLNSSTFFPKVLMVHHSAKNIIQM